MNRYILLACLFITIGCDLDSPVTYEYDELSRLTKVVIPHNRLEVNYTYDAMGNRLDRSSKLTEANQ
jgi:hypothetical protein